MFGFARSITWLLVVALLAVNFDGLFGAFIQMKKAENRWFGDRDGNFKIVIAPGTPAAQKPLLQVAHCNVSLELSGGSSPVIKIAGQPDPFGAHLAIRVTPESIHFVSDNHVEVPSECKPEYVKANKLNFINVKLDGELPDDFAVQLYAKEMLTSKPSESSTGNSTGPNNGAEVGRSVGIGSMVVFGLLAVRVF
ncbi:hypothetical protein M3Y94_00023200 [Aphelenchoides besseyi]|nr:hypothetical protein M3Y94_00023200 [Aphelenchoides besseyi]KAI6217079.1 hypothetical protein M3Y95_01243500 [Aphelenchoides besseyi]